MKNAPTSETYIPSKQFEGRCFWKPRADYGSVQDQDVSFVVLTREYHVPLWWWFMYQEPRLQVRHSFIATPRGRVLHPCCASMGSDAYDAMDPDAAETPAQIEDRLLLELGLARNHPFSRSLWPPGVPPIFCGGSDAPRRIPGRDAPEYHFDEMPGDRSRVPWPELPPESRPSQLPESDTYTIPIR